MKGGLISVFQKAIDEGEYQVFKANKLADVKIARAINETIDSKSNSKLNLKYQNDASRLCGQVWKFVLRAYKGETAITHTSTKASKASERTNGKTYDEHLGVSLNEAEKEKIFLRLLKTPQPKCKYHLSKAEVNTLEAELQKNIFMRSSPHAMKNVLDNDDYLESEKPSKRESIVNYFMQRTYYMGQAYHERNAYLLKNFFDYRSTCISDNEINLFLRAKRVKIMSEKVYANMQKLNYKELENDYILTIEDEIFFSKMLDKHADAWGAYESLSKYSSTMKALCALSALSLGSTLFFIISSKSSGNKTDQARTKEPWHHVIQIAGCAILALVAWKSISHIRANKKSYEPKHELTKEDSAISLNMNVPEKALALPHEKNPQGNNSLIIIDQNKPVNEEEFAANQQDKPLAVIPSVVRQSPEQIERMKRKHARRKERDVLEGISEHIKLQHTHGNGPRLVILKHEQIDYSKKYGQCVRIKENSFFLMERI